MPHILIVEADIATNNLLNDLLKKDYEITTSFSGTEAMMVFEKIGVDLDLIILDLMLPGKNGEEIINEIREKSDIPIVVTAKGDISTLVKMLDIGADDYISKPFDVREVEARVKYHIRKKIGRKCADDGEILKYENLNINMMSRVASVDDKKLLLTQKEFDVLALLVKEPKRVFTKEMLYTKVWEEVYYGDDNTINVHISRLRSKLKETMNKDIIDTVWGVGFRLKLE